MMKLYRYMSMREFSMMSCGCDIMGKSDFSKCRTDSVGVCFLGEKTKINSNYYNDEADCYETVSVDFSPEACISFLSGIVTNDVLVEFEVVDSDRITESFGIYADPINTGDWYATISVVEYCVPSYNRDTLVPTRYALVDNWNHTVWYDFN